MTLTKKTVIRLEKLDGSIHDIKLNYDDATREVIEQAATQLIGRYGLYDGDSITVITAEVEE